MLTLRYSSSNILVDFPVQRLVWQARSHMQLAPFERVGLFSFRSSYV